MYKWESRILGEFPKDEEYDAYLRLWKQFHRETKHLSEKNTAATLLIYDRIFAGVPTKQRRCEKSLKAREESERSLDG